MDVTTVLLVLALSVFVTSFSCSILSYHLGWSDRGDENKKYLVGMQREIRRLKRQQLSDQRRVDEAHIRINALNKGNKFLHQQLKAMFGAIVRMPGVDVNRLKAELFGGAKSKN